MSYSPPSFSGVDFQPPGAIRYPAPAFDAVDFPPISLVAFDCVVDGVIDAGTIAYSISEVRYNIPVLWSLATGRFGITTARAAIPVRGRIKTNSIPVYSFITSGSVMGRIRVKYRIRTGG